MQGFIPHSRGSLMLDVVAVAMAVIIPVMIFGIYLAKTKRAYSSHRNIMLSLALTLAVAVVLFELEIRFLGWRDLAQPSPYYETLVPLSLGVHLVFSITSTLLLATIVTKALKNFGPNPRPNDHSFQHKFLGKLTAIGLIMTSITGWIFYYLAFVAS